MVEPVTVGVIAAALVAKAIERAEERVLDGGEGVLQRLLETVRGRFSQAGDEVGEGALRSVEEAPDSPKRIQELATRIDATAAGSPDFQRALEALVEEARGSGIDVSGTIQVATGNQNVQAAGLSQSEVNVSFRAESEPDRDI